MPDTAAHPFAAAAMIFFASSACAITIIQSGTTEQVLSSDTHYVLPADGSVQTSADNAILVSGIAPVAVDSAGKVVSSTDNVAAGYRFEVPCLLNQSASGSVLGTIYDVWMNDGGSGNDIVNRGDISPRVSHAIDYAGTTSSTVDNFGTLNGGVAGPGGTTSEGVHMSSSGTLVINNHAGASIVSGVGVIAEQGQLTVNNDGVISGVHAGVEQIGTATTRLVNGTTGSVTGTQAPGVLVKLGSMVIVNDGLISGTSAGIAGGSGANLVGTNGATGSIRASEGPGLLLFTGNTLVNNGVIAGVNGLAMLLRGDNSITLGTGSSLSSGFNTAILSREAGNTITLRGTGTEAGDFAVSIGAGFATLTSTVGSVWTLSGAVTIGGASAASLDVTGDLTLGGLLMQAGGGTTIEAGGQLTLGAGGASSMVSGDIQNNGTLRFNRSDEAIFTGALQQNGSGSVALSAAGSSQGSVGVNAGALRLLQNGAFAVTGDFVTAPGAATLLGAQSQLIVGNRFTMNGTLNQILSAIPKHRSSRRPQRLVRTRISISRAITRPPSRARHNSPTASSRRFTRPRPAG
ncbi:YapH protein [Candidatus Burkholderia humilis]|nr:YapH protein [Candidatus Burkholderia humilis]